MEPAQLLPLPGAGPLASQAGAESPQRCRTACPDGEGKGVAGWTLQVSYSIPTMVPKGSDRHPHLQMGTPKSRLDVVTQSINKRLGLQTQVCLPPVYLISSSPWWPQGKSNPESGKQVPSWPAPSWRCHLPGKAIPGVVTVHPELGWQTPRWNALSCPPLPHQKGLGLGPRLGQHFPGTSPPS